MPTRRAPSLDKAAIGPRSVTVANPDGQSGTLSSGFSVTSSGPPPPPNVSSVNPNSGGPGQNLPSVVITGSSFQSGASCTFGAGTTVNSCSFNSSTQLTANISISSTAARGPRNVTVTNPDTQTGTLAGGFTATSGTAGPITLIQKATFSRQPSSSGTVNLTLPQATGAGHALIVGVSFYPLDLASVTDGSGDKFTRGLATSIFHSTSQGAMYTNFFYAKSTAGGSTSLTLQFSGGSTYVFASVVEVAGLDPTSPLDKSAYNESLSSTATPWSSATLTTTAANEYLFSWAASEWTGTTCSSPTSGWTIESQINDPSGATVCMVDRIVSATGSYQVSVVPASPQNYAMELLAFKGSSSSTAPPPSVTSVIPNSGAQGQNLPSVTITGSNFQSSATCGFGSGITVNSCGFASSTQLTANITISSTATVGTRNVTVTNPDGQSGTLTNGFTVTLSGPPPPPSVSSVNPNSGNPGQNLPSVTITGSNFQSGATCSFGSGITVNSCAFSSSTQLTANISISSTATVGARNVTVTNPDTQTGTLTAGFTVTAPAAISLIQKATFSRQPSSSGTLTLSLPQATGAGHALIVGVSFWPLDITNVTDSSSDGFTRGLASSIFHNTSQGAMYTNFFYTSNTAGGATSLTLQFSGGSTYVLVSVSEVAGLNQSAQVRKVLAYNHSLDGFEISITIEVIIPGM